MTDKAQVRAPRRVRIGMMALVVVLHVAAVFGLVHAFAPSVTTVAVDRVMQAFTVTVTAPPPEPPPPPESRADEGAAAPEGPKARPREVAAPPRTLPRTPRPVPPVSSTGTENASGAAESGAGTGRGGEGAGTGSGREGTGQGGIVARKLEKIAGDINSAKDYPKKTRDLRINQSVTILLGVGADGRVTDCRVTVPSPDAEADAITCRLATERFRFRPALDRNGNPVAGKYAWRQRWFY